MCPGKQVKRAHTHSRTCRHVLVPLITSKVFLGGLAVHFIEQALTHIAPDTALAAVVACASVTLPSFILMALGDASDALDV